jgi:hypothetical protein
MRRGGRAGGRVVRTEGQAALVTRGLGGAQETTEEERRSRRMTLDRSAAAAEGDSLPAPTTSRVLTGPDDE